MFDCLHFSGVDADQVIGKRRQVLRVEPVRAELLEQGVVLGFTVLPVDFQLSDGEGAGKLDEFGHALAECGQRFAAAIEEEAVRYCAAGFLCRRGGGGKELLRAEHVQQAADALPAAFGKHVLGQGFGEHARHGVEVERVAEAAAYRGLQVLGAAPGFGALVVGLEDVGQFQHHPVQILAEVLGFLLLYRSPGVLQQARGQGRVAVCDLAVDFDRGAGAAQAVFKILVGSLAKAASRLGP